MKRIIASVVLAALIAGTPTQAAPILFEDLKITPPDGERDNHFGCHVAIHEGLALTSTSVPGDGASAFLLFDSYTGKPLRQLQEPMDDDGRPVEALTYRLGFNAAGAPLAILNRDPVFPLGGETTPAFGRSFSEHTFDPDSGEQASTRALAPADVPGQYAAYAVSGDLALVGRVVGRLSGDPLDPDFDQIGYLLPGPRGLDPISHRQIAISGDYIAVGGVPYGGRADGLDSVEVFHLPTQKLVAQLRPSDGRPFDDFGHSLAFRGNRVIIGYKAGVQPGVPVLEQQRLNSVYVFTLVPEPTTAALAVILAATLTVGRRR